MRNISEYLVNESLYKTISLEELINAILKGKDYPAGTKIVFDKSKLEYDEKASYYNNNFYKHIPSNCYLKFETADDEVFVRILLYLPNESFNNFGHHIADDDDGYYCWDKIFDDDIDEFTVKYKEKIT